MGNALIVRRGGRQQSSSSNVKELLITSSSDATYAATSYGVDGFSRVIIDTVNSPIRTDTLDTDTQGMFYCIKNTNSTEIPLKIYKNNILAKSVTLPSTNTTYTNIDYFNPGTEASGTISSIPSYGYKSFYIKGNPGDIYTIWAGDSQVTSAEIANLTFIKVESSLDTNFYSATAATVIFNHNGRDHTKTYDGLCYLGVYTDEGYWVNPITFATSYQSAIITAHDGYIQVNDVLRFEINSSYYFGTGGCAAYSNSADYPNVAYNNHKWLGRFYKGGWTGGAPYEGILNFYDIMQEIERTT